MTKRIVCISIGLLVAGIITSFHPGEKKILMAAPADSTVAAKGEATFNLYCTICHNFRQDAIGPQLGGVTSRVSTAWIRNFIRDPQKMISSGDKRAKQLAAKFKVVMPSFSSLNTKDIDGLIAFLTTKTLPARLKDLENIPVIENPVPAAIKMSGVVVNLQLVAQFPSSIDSNKVPIARITKLEFQPASGTLFVVDLRGKLFRLSGDTPSVYMDISKLKPAFIDKPGFGSGFGSFAFHPQFDTNGLLYTTHTESAKSAPADFSFADSIKVQLQWVVTEWKAADPAAAVFAGKGRELFRINMVAPNHGIQDISFNPLAKPGSEDYGLLYIGIGDGGAVENGFPQLVHSPSRIWGSILRIDPAARNSANGQYGIPPQNPFANKGENMRGEIFAYGFRNPHRITWTSTGQMLAFNIGHGSIESINLVRKGQDYGWPIREGNFRLYTAGNLNKVYPLPSDDARFHVTYPVAQYDHDEGKAICGGYEYTGTAIPALQGKILFGDIPLGRLFYVDRAALVQGKQAIVKEWKISFDGKETDLVKLCGNKRVDLHFGKDAQGELYVLTKADGKLYRINGASESTAR